MKSLLNSKIPNNTSKDISFSKTANKNNDTLSRTKASSKDFSNSSNDLSRLSKEIVDIKKSKIRKQIQHLS